MSTGFSSENIVFLSDTVINLLSEDGVLYSSTPFKLNYSNYYLNKIQCDINGRFIAVGSANYNSYQGSIQDFIVCRFNKNGTLDNSFGTEGSVVTDFGYSDYADGVAIQNDGKILVVGSSRNGDFQSDFALARYLENGVLDQTFGVGGQVMINLGTLDQARSVMELPDGKIIIIGGDNKSYNPNIAIVRLNQNGTFDTSFGNNGVVSTDLGGSESGWGGAVQSDGKVIAIGSNYNDLIALRYNQNGSLDQSFGNKGIVIIDLGGEEWAYSVAIQKDNKIIIAGDTYNANNNTKQDFALVRLNSDGSFDYTFDGKPDTTAPSVSSFSPADGAVGVAVGSDITVTFSEAIQRGTGNIQIRSGSESGTVVASYDVATSANLSISGSTLTINPTADLGYSTDYFVTFDSGSIMDLAGNGYTGISTYDFTTPTKNNTTTSTQTLNDIASVGVSPDNSTLLIKFNSGELMSLPNLSGGGTVSLGGTSVSTSAIAQHTTPQAVFTSLTGGVTDYVLPELYKGGLNLKYQHIDTTPNAVVVGSTDNDFIKVADTHSLGKAVNGGGGSDVIDGGVGSTFVTGGTGHHGDTFFLDGRAPGVSWSTITDFQLGSDQATIWGFVKGVSSVDSSFANPNNEGAGGIYNGLTLHFKNLLADGLATGSNADLNSITLSGHTLADIGVSSLQDLNNKINNAQTANALGQYVVNEHIIIGQTQDALGTHSYLFLH
jgi:uncharacterized delta-60 repeat protein